MTDDVLTYEEHQRFIKSFIDKYNSEINQGEHIKDELKSYSLNQPDMCDFVDVHIVELYKYIDRRNEYLRSEVERLRKMWDGGLRE